MREGAGDVEAAGEVGDMGADGDWSSASGSCSPSEGAAGVCWGRISSGVNLGGMLASGWKPSSMFGLGVLPTVLNLVGPGSTSGLPAFQPRGVRGVAVFGLLILLDMDLPRSFAPLATPALLATTLNLCDDAASSAACRCDEAAAS